MNKSITVIPARKRVGNTVNMEDKPKLRVAAYCRVSTDSDEQATSYDAQIEHYTNFIQKMKTGNLPRFLLMMVFQALTLKSVKNLIV